jgi:DNA-binding NarL/FixJ family response regulator
MKPIRILLADDHPVVQDGLRALLGREPDMAIVAEAADGRETVRSRKVRHEARSPVGVAGS